MSKHRVLSLKPHLRLERRGQDGQNETEQPDHSASLGDSITSSTRIRFSVHTPVDEGSTPADLVEYARRCREAYRLGQPVPRRNEAGPAGLSSSLQKKIDGWTATLTEETLRKSPVPVAFLRAGWFMENASRDVEAGRNECVCTEGDSANEGRLGLGCQVPECHHRETRQSDRIAAPDIDSIGAPPAMKLQRPVRSKLNP
jgi:hypothetical protein